MNEKRTLQVFLGIVLGGIFVVGSMWFFFFTREIRHPSLPIYGNVPDFTLTERSGRMVRLNDLLGQIWIADFIFTNCACACPMMSSNMKQMQNLLNDKSDVKLVSITVDPARDSPQALSEYAKKYGARADQWLFLTGDGAAIRKLAVQGFLVSATAGANPKDEIAHSSRFVLIDRRGRIRGYFDGESPGVTRSLLAAMDELEKEGR